MNFIHFWFETFARGSWLAARLSTLMRIRRHSNHPTHATMSKAHETHPAPLANEGGRLHWYRTREAIEEALTPVALLMELCSPDPRLARRTNTSYLYIDLI